MGSNIEPNSYKAQKESKDSKKAKRVVQGPVHEKQTAIDKVKDEIVSEDAHTVKEYLVWDVLLPSLRQLLADLGHEMVNMVFGKDRSRGRDDREHYVRYDRPSYDRRSSYSSRDRRDRRDSYGSMSRKRRHDFDRIVIDNKKDAELVFDELVESTLRYGVATVADFYEALGMDTTYVDFRWGWYDLSTGRVERVRDGYILSLPRPRPIDEED